MSIAPVCILRLLLNGEQQGDPACIIDRLHAIVYYTWKAIASIVMLSEAKHLAAHRERPFASLRVTTQKKCSGIPCGCQAQLSTILVYPASGVVQ